MEIKEVTFSYNRIYDHLRGISENIEQGKITTIIGPNGCGKSTLLGVISTNYVANRGEIVLDGKRLNSYRPKELARRLAIVHQHNEAPDDLTVERLVRYGRLPYQGLLKSDREADEAAVNWALSCTNLEDKRQFLVGELSGGERQRVWIALALAQKSPFLCLDEPTTYLDIYYQMEVLELIRQLNVRHGLTILMVLHDINQAIRYSDKIIVMRNGEIVASGPPEQVITKETVHAVYGVDVALRTDPEAGLYIVPIGI